MAIDVEVLYRRYGPMVLRRCRGLLRDETEALDAMHDTFVRLLKARTRLDARAPSSLLYQTATRVCLNRLRARRRRPEDADEALLLRLAAIEDQEARSVARGVLRHLLATEPPSTATLAVLHLHDGLTLEQVADVVGLSVSGVRKRLRKLRAAAHDLEVA